MLTRSRSHRSALPLGLALGLTLAATPAAAADEPPDVAALPWREACTLDSAEVNPPLARMPKDLFEDWGLPRTRDSADWQHWHLIVLGLALETGWHGTLDPPDPAAAARVYCLAVRRDDMMMAAAFLSRLHARGQGVAFSPARARHLMRLAAPVWEPADLAPMFVLGPLAAPPDLETMQGKLADARDWLARQLAKPPAALETVALAYLAGQGVPQSEFLAEHLYLHAAMDVGTDPADFGVLLRYIDKRLMEHRRGRDQHPLDRYLLASRLYRIAHADGGLAAQRKLGTLYLSGNLVPRYPPAAYAWLEQARQSGLDPQPHLALASGQITPETRRAIDRMLARGLLPPPVYEADDLAEFEKFLSGFSD
jgi:hypothetical protein